MRFVRSISAGSLVLMLALLTLAACSSSPEAKSARFIDSGKKFLAKNDTARAILAFRNAVRVTPKSAEAYYQLGMAYLAAGDPAGVGSLKRAIDLNPKHKLARLRYAELMSQAHDEKFAKEGEQRLQELLQDDGNDPEALHALALTEFRLGNEQQAMLHLGMASAAAPQDVAIATSMAQAKLAKKDVKGAEAVLLEAARKSPKSIDAAIVLAQFYHSQNRIPEAEQQFEKAVANGPHDTVALFDLALIQNELGKKQDAEQTLKRLSVLASPLNYKYASYLLDEGKNDEALREFERLAKVDREDRMARTRLVLAYRKINRPDEASRVLNDALKKNAKDTDALLQRGEMFLDNGKYEQAEADLNRVVQMRPQAAQVHYILGKLYQAKGSDARFQQEMAKALELDPFLLQVRQEYSQALLASHPDTALDIMNGAPPSQHDSVAFLAARNWALWGLGNMAEMRKGIDQGLALERSSELLIQDGLWKLRSGDAVRARAVLEEALKLNPGDLRGIQALRETYLVQKDAPKALAAVQEFAKKNPASAPIQNYLGTVLMAKGELKEAQVAFAAANSASPGYQPAQLALAQLDVLQGNLENAKNRLKTLLASDPNNLTANLWMGILTEKTGDKKGALRLYRKVAEAQPDNAQASNNLAYLLSEVGNKPEEALQYAEKAVQLAPENPAYCDTLGWILYRKGVYDSAVSYLERASAQRGKDTALWDYHLAMAYAKTGKVARGRTILASALKINPNLPEAKLAQQVLNQAQNEVAQ